jgi:hypothetical protein
MNLGTKVTILIWEKKYLILRQVRKWKYGFPPQLCFYVGEILSLSSSHTNKLWPTESDLRILGDPAPLISILEDDPLFFDCRDGLHSRLEIYQIYNWD